MPGLHGLLNSPFEAGCFFQSIIVCTGLQAPAISLLQTHSDQHEQDSTSETCSIPHSEACSILLHVVSQKQKISAQIKVRAASYHGQGSS